MGERIREARERADLSQKELGQRTNLERTAINKIESGTRKVTALELSDIAAAIGVRMSTFFADPLPALVSHRSSQGLDTVDSQIDSLLARLADDVEFVASLGMKELGIDSAEKLPDGGFPLPATGAESEKLAKTARNLMDLSPDEPIVNLTKSVAGIGLLAFSRNIGSDTADAGTILLRKGGVSLINSSMKIGRRRLALAHELGHYLVADDYTVDWRVSGAQAEDSANESKIERFARALLLPETAVKDSWKEIIETSDERSAAIRLGNKFRVDMGTLATRLRELGIVGSQDEASIRQTRTTQLDMIEMDLHVPLEELAATSVPAPFTLAVVGLVRTERISKERALELLQETIDEADLPTPRKRRPEEIWSFVS
ncbi:ImmA/IrrE family metallo-endopeptidase [Arthrobacter sp. ISL-30]|nr:ImmA/IrrE family metallo-endopeptidase [Arthrobacter sp. ISL-30]